MSKRGADAFIEQLHSCKFLSESDMKELCKVVKELLIEESNVVQLTSPVTVCGDIHGQFFDFLELLRQGGPVSETNYVFIGDFVDRGNRSLETFSLLMAYKMKYPDKITLLRGNHECRQITQVYGFYEECQAKYGSPATWLRCTEVFDLLPLAAIIDGRVLCVHGGLSPDIVTIDQINTIPRMNEIPHEGPFCDLMWSDPEDVATDTWQVSPRGAGWLFGSQVAKEFNHINGLELICRAHQLVQEGYKYMFPEQSVVTVWSAPNYCYRCGNVASILEFDAEMKRRFKTFDSAPDAAQEAALDSAPRKLYFL